MSRRDRCSVEGSRIPDGSRSRGLVPLESEGRSMSKRTIKMEMDLNRVEGDVEIKLEVEGHTVVDAWCIGTTYRGYEQILLGRDPKDVLVITPRICGICSTSQLYAATT